MEIVLFKDPLASKVVLTEQEKVLLKKSIKLSNIERSIHAIILEENPLNIKGRLISALLNDDRVEELYEGVLGELEDGVHCGGCTCQPCPCFKCYSEGFLDINTNPVEKHIACKFGIISEDTDLEKRIQELKNSDYSKCPESWKNKESWDIHKERFKRESDAAAVALETHRLAYEKQESERQKVEKAGPS